MRVVLIGGCGFIGHHLARHLRICSHEVMCVDSLTVNNLYSHWPTRADKNVGKHIRMLEQRIALLEDARIPLFRMDARDYHILSHALGMFCPEAFIHLAAVAHLDRARKDPHSTFDHSLRTLENALDIAVAVNAEHFVYFSSSTVYGNFAYVPIDEEAPVDPIGTYGSLKLAGELMVKAYKRDRGLDYTIIRPQALYGPRCVSGRVIQRFIEQAMDGELLHVAGEGEIDFTHVQDVVRCIAACLESPKAKGETFNVSAGNARTIRSVADLVWKRFPETLIVAQASDGYRPVRGTMNIAKAAELLEWRPFWQLERGLTDYMNWYAGFWN